MLAAARATTKAPPAVALLIAAFLCPTEFSVFLGDLRLPPHRIALLIITPFALMRLARQRGLKFCDFDAWFALFNVWTVGVFVQHLGQYDGLVYGGSLALESFGAYLVARVYIRTPQDFDAAIAVLLTAIAIAALIALPETLFGQTFTHDLLKSVTGYAHPTAVETRLHLTRAYGTFDHPIHYGTFCAGMLAFVWFASRNREQARNRVALLVGATFLGLSSGPILCLILQAAMLVWEKMTRGVASRTTMTLATLAGLYLCASMVMSRSPINLIATGLTLDSWTGFYRLQIWEHGLENVYASPWIGIGLEEWQRPWWMISSTIDALWLVIAIREGVPAVALLALGVAAMTRAVVRKGLRGPDRAVRRIARGWIMSLIALALVACTVHFWNVLYAYFFFFVGLAGWMADPTPERQAAPVAQRLVTKGARRGGRFAYPLQAGEPAPA